MQAQAQVERLSADRFNFSPLLDKLQQPSPEPKADTGPARFAVLNIRLRDGVVRYADRVLDQTHRLDRIRLEVPFVSSLPSDVDVTVQPLLEAHVDGSALRVVGRTHPFQTALHSEVDVRWQDVDLAHWLEVARPFLPEAWRPQDPLAGDGARLAPALPVPGAHAYLLKDATEQEVLDTVRAVHRGESRLSPTIARTLIRRTRALQDPAGCPVAGLYTYGEIARTSGSTGFHNLTVVLLAFG